MDVPVTIQSGDAVTLNVANLPPNCFVSSASVDLFASTAAGLSTLSAAGNFSMSLSHLGTSRTVFSRAASGLTGNAIGTGCTSTTFEDTGGSFAAAAAPYAGSFAPTDSFDTAAGFLGADGSGTWSLMPNYSDAGTLTVQCWSVTLTVGP